MSDILLEVENVTFEFLEIIQRMNEHKSGIFRTPDGKLYYVLVRELTFFCESRADCKTCSGVYCTNAEKNNVT